MRKKYDLPFILAISKISGIGVFTTNHLKKGDNVNFPGRNRLIDKRQFLRLPKKQRDWISNHCIPNDSGYRNVPVDGISTEFFLNNSSTPNMGLKGEDWITLRSIKAGEEMTINYNDCGIDCGPLK